MGASIFGASTIRIPVIVLKSKLNGVLLLAALRKGFRESQLEFDGQFTGQDICYYTAPGAETTIRINRAMNVLAEETELELERQRNATTIYGYRVTIQEG